MAKEWILNSTMNRFQLNFKKNVGAVSEEIRKCTPRTVAEWRKYYFSNVKSRQHIEDLGRKLYVKISEVVSLEAEQVTEQDCIEYMLNMVINRTFDGYETEIKTIYGQLQVHFDHKIEPAPDKWDRLYNVDFFIRIGKKYIGIQIKPLSGTAQIMDIHKERALQQKTHMKFTKEFGGAVFYVFSLKEGGKKTIHNTEVIEEIRKEIKRLGK